MSIINDALKKVQKSIEGNAAESQKTPSPDTGRVASLSSGAPRIATSLFNTDTVLPNPKSAKKSGSPNAMSLVTAAFTVQNQRKNDRLLITLCSLICGILVFLIGYLFYVFGMTHPNQHPFKKEARAYAPNEIVIQGIMARDDKKVALINDEIYEVGQTIKGRRIISISEDSVQISHQGKIKNLQVK
jgi:hypothetical protein